jgi:hypothetical protein
VDLTEQVTVKTGWETAISRATEQVLADHAYFVVATSALTSENVEELAAEVRKRGSWETLHVGGPPAVATLV